MSDGSGSAKGGADAAGSCPQCGATQQRGVSRCWLCGAPRDPDAAIVAEIVREAPANPHTFALTSIFLVITLVGVILGLAREAPGLAIPLAIVAVPAFLATTVRAGRQAARGRPMSTGEKIGSFILAAASVVGAVFVLVLACVAALFLYCVVQLGGI